MRIRNRALLTAILAAKGGFRHGLRPEPRIFDGITIAPFKDDARAAVTISADFELSWAFRHHSVLAVRAKAQQELASLSRLGRALRSALLVHAVRDSFGE